MDQHILKITTYISSSSIYLTSEFAYANLPLGQIGRNRSEQKHRCNIQHTFYPFIFVANKKEES